MHFRYLKLTLLRKNSLFPVWFVSGVICVWLHGINFLQNGNLKIKTTSSLQSFFPVNTTLSQCAGLRNPRTRRAILAGMYVPGRFNQARKVKEMESD